MSANTRKPIIHIHLIDRLAFANGVLSGMSIIPQVVQVLVTKEVAGISTLSYALIWINSIIWLTYALHRGLISLGISSVLNVSASTILLLSLLILA